MSVQLYIRRISLFQVSFQLTYMFPPSVFGLCAYYECCSLFLNHLD